MASSLHPEATGPLIRTLAIEISQKAYFVAISEFRSDGEW
jgi:hypothetical protein